MGDGRLQSLLNVFRGKESTDEDYDAYFEELFVTVLARATSADTNIEPREIKTVQQLYEEVFDKELESGAVRTAAKSEIFETTPFETYVKTAGKKLKSTDKHLLCRSVLQVMAADDRHSQMEIDFFNQVINGLDMTPAEIVGFLP